MTLAEQLLSAACFLLILAVAIIGYFLRDLIKSNKEKHAIHFQHHEAVEKKILSNDEILAVVNGKYVSRREMDLLLHERGEWRTAQRDRLNALEQTLLQRVTTADAEILRLRDEALKITQQLWSMVAPKN